MNYGMMYANDDEWQYAELCAKAESIDKFLAQAIEIDSRNVGNLAILAMNAEDRRTAMAQKLAEPMPCLCVGEGR